MNHPSSYSKIARMTSLVISQWRRKFERSRHHRDDASLRDNVTVFAANVAVRHQLEQVSGTLHHVASLLTW